MTEALKDLTSVVEEVLAESCEPLLPEPATVHTTPYLEQQQTPKPIPRKRKRAAEKPADDMSCGGGRPTHENSLLKIANEDEDKDWTGVTSQELILLTGAGTEKKEKLY